MEPLLCPRVFPGYIKENRPGTVQGTGHRRSTTATGGRAVLHDKEITYSVTISLSLLPGSILETYRFISRGLVEAVNQLGLRAGS